MRQVGIRNSLLGLLAVAAIGALGTAASPASAAERSIFKLTDPRGDDHGDGGLTYPQDYYGLYPGDLDLVSLEAFAVDGGTEFEAGFVDRIRPPGRRTIDAGGTNLDTVARFGFYEFNIDIYIDTDRVPGSGAVKTIPGRRAEIAPSNAWEKAICLTPRPYEARSQMKRILLKQLKRQMNAEPGRVKPEDAARMKQVLPDDLDAHFFFPNKIRVTGSKIRFFVPDSFLGGTAKDTWSYVVIVTGADIDLRFEIEVPGLGKDSDERLMNLPIIAGGGTDRFGGGRDDGELQPPIVDLIAPPGMTQEQELSDFNSPAKRPVVLTGVVPADVEKKPVPQP